MELNQKSRGIHPAKKRMAGTSSYGTRKSRRTALEQIAFLGPHVQYLPSSKTRRTSERIPTFSSGQVSVLTQPLE